MDGCNRWQTLWQVLWPLAKPSITTLIVLIFMWTWNEFLLALVLIQDETLRTLPWLPLRDVLALASWALALTRNTFEWRGNTFKLTRGGRIVPRDGTP